MKKIDVLIIYEHKARELENCALLSAELENRGYITKVLYMYSMPKRWNIEAKVIITPHLYNDEQLSFFIMNKECSNKRIIDLQYEQVLSRSSEDGIHNPSGQAKAAHHIAWGEAQTKRYRNHGIKESNIHEVGSIAMDLFRPEFSKYFITREELSKRYDLDSYKEWILFISSFSYAHRSKQEVELLSRLNPNAKEFARISEVSYHTILSWFEEALSMYPNKLFIYRRHPSELNDDYLNKIESKYENFRCIDSYSIRQWTIVADKIYNWFSTSLADVYFAGKKCYILRPCHIPEHLDVSIMVGGDYVNTKTAFFETLNSTDNRFPVSSDKIEYYYANKRTGKMAFQKTADLCVDLMNEGATETDFILHKPNKNLRFAIKYLYDYLLYEYGLRVKTPRTLISCAKLFPFLKNTAFKLKLFNNDLYDANRLLNEYKTKFRKILEALTYEEKD